MNPKKPEKTAFAAALLSHKIEIIKKKEYESDKIKNDYI